MKYVYKTLVPFSQVGVGEGLSVIGAAQIIEDSLCAFFAEFGRDSVTLQREYGAVWMFVKNKFQKRAIAGWNEEITVESYFTAINAATVIVDTVIKNRKGEISVAARTEACVIDLSAQRIRRLSSVDFPQDMAVYESEAGFAFTRFDVGNITEKYRFTVPSTSIDFCKHLNNVEYFRFILNSASVETELLRPVSEAEIYYVNQAREGEELTVFSANCQENEYYEIKNGGKTVAKCNIKRLR